MLGTTPWAILYGPLRAKSCGHLAHRYTSQLAASGTRGTPILFGTGFAWWAGGVFEPCAAGNRKRGLWSQPRQGRKRLATGASPWDRCGTGAQAPEGRQMVGTVVLSERFCRPAGALSLPRDIYHRLAPVAKCCRPSGAFPAAVALSVRRRGRRVEHRHKANAVPNRIGVPHTIM